MLSEDELLVNQHYQQRIYANYLKVNKMFECIINHVQSDSFLWLILLEDEYLQIQELKLALLFLTRFVHQNQLCCHLVFYLRFKELCFLLLDFYQL